MKRKLAIARALVHSHPILFLDELTANLDPELSKEIRDLIEMCKREMYDSALYISSRGC